MTTHPDEGRLTLSFLGPAVVDGAVPVGVLAAKLLALQSLLFHAAAAVRNDSAARRGLWTNRYRGEAELTFVASSPGSLVVELDLPPLPPLLRDENDRGGSLLDLVFQFGNSIQRDESTPELRIRRGDEEYLLRAFDALSPGAQDEYRIELANSTSHRHPKLVLDQQTKRFIRRRLSSQQPPRIQEVTTLIGELIKIYVDVSPEKITVRSQGREIDCFYPNALRDQIANLLAGSMVEVTGEATLSSQLQIEKLDPIIDVLTVSTDPLRITRLEHGGQVFQFQAPLVVDVEISDGLWIFHNQLIRLWGSGERRDDALADLQENFAYLWREFAQEVDEVLDDRAREVKRALLALVKTEQVKV